MSAKNLDSKGRFRSKTVGFRVSPQEWEQLKIAIKLSGFTHQDYLSKRIVQRNIVVQGNPRVYKALRNQLRDVLVALQDKEVNVTDELLETINLITITLQGLNKVKGFPKWKELIKTMGGQFTQS